jgi:hypothetical protein
MEIKLEIKEGKMIFDRINFQFFSIISFLILKHVLTFPFFYISTGVANPNWSLGRIGKSFCKISTFWATF